MDENLRLYHFLTTFSWESPQLWGLYFPTLHFPISVNSPALHFPHWFQTSHSLQTLRPEFSLLLTLVSKSSHCTPWVHTIFDDQLNFSRARKNNSDLLLYFIAIASFIYFNSFDFWNNWTWKAMLSYVKTEAHCGWIEIKPHNKHWSWNSSHVSWLQTITYLYNYLVSLRIWNIYHEYISRISGICTNQIWKENQFARVILIWNFYIKYPLYHLILWTKKKQKWWNRLTIGDLTTFDI
jgi:hypothetical protein